MRREQRREIPALNLKDQFAVLVISIQHCIGFRFFSATVVFAEFFIFSPFILSRTLSFKIGAFRFNKKVELCLDVCVCVLFHRIVKSHFIKVYNYKV